MRVKGYFAGIFCIEKHGLAMRLGKGGGATSILPSRGGKDGREYIEYNSADYYILFLVFIHQLVVNGDI